MAVICPDFKWLGFQILNLIQNPDHLQTNLFWTIQNPDYSGFQILTVHWGLSKRSFNALQFFFHLSPEFLHWHSDVPHTWHIPAM